MWFQLLLQQQCHFQLVYPARRTMEKPKHHTPPSRNPRPDPLKTKASTQPAHIARDQDRTCTLHTAKTSESTGLRNRSETTDMTTAKESILLFCTLCTGTLNSRCRAGDHTIFAGRTHSEETRRQHAIETGQTCSQRLG